MRNACERGMTLIELMVVVVILGLLVAIVGPRIPGIIERSSVRIAKAQMANLGDAVMQYRLEYRKLPASLETLTEPDPHVGEPFLDHVPDDPWGLPYDYRVLTPKQYEIRSCGSDGLAGTDDDLHHPVYFDGRDD